MKKAKKKLHIFQTLRRVPCGGRGSIIHKRMACGAKLETLAKNHVPHVSPWEATCLRCLDIEEKRTYTKEVAARKLANENYHTRLKLYRRASAIRHGPTGAPS